MILILDNYDSFTYNLADYVGRSTSVQVVRNDAISVAQVERLRPDGIVISPGPGHPENLADFGVCADVITHVGRTTPILGVCLGLQGIGHVFGAKVVHAPQMMHGKTSAVTHDQRGVFSGLPNPLTCVRYHSLVVRRDSVPPSLEVTATTPDDQIMGLRHREYPIEGVQFHPESIGTEHGINIIENFLGSCGSRQP